MLFVAQGDTCSPPETATGLRYALYGSHNETNSRKGVDALSQVRSVDRLMRLLSELAKSPTPLALARLSERTGLDKATARRFALSLAELGYVERDVTGRYRLTSKLPDLLESVRRPALALQRGHEILRALRAETGLAVSVSRLQGREVEYILREPHGSVRGVPLDEGARLPAHATAIGKVLLAELPAGELRRTFPRERLSALTERTIASRALLEGALHEIRRQGWALSDGELAEGLCAAAVPVRGDDGIAFCALNASSDDGGVERERFALEVVPKLLRAAPQLAVILSESFQTSSR